VSAPSTALKKNWFAAEMGFFKSSPHTPPTTMPATFSQVPTTAELKQLRSEDQRGKFWEAENRTPRRSEVAQISKSAVSQVSKPARLTLRHSRMNSASA
jgi:hypothetical protein